MDLGLHLRVVWRFKYLVAAGFVLACSLATLAVARIDSSHGFPPLSYRKPEIWSGSEKLLITQKGVPWGRLALPTQTTPSATTTTPTTTGQVFADPSRLSSLAPFYAQLANSAAIQHSLPPGAVRASPVVDTSTPYSGVLPIVQFTAVGTTPFAAEKLAQQAADLFKSYVTRQQANAAIPQGERVLLQPLNDRIPPQLVQPRKKSLAIVAFVTIMIATLGLAFILENLRPARPAVVEVGADDVDRRLALGKRTA